jgi:hypothetical protein
LLDIVVPDLSSSSVGNVSLGKAVPVEDDELPDALDPLEYPSLLDIDMPDLSPSNVGSVNLGTVRPVE